MAPTYKPIFDERTAQTLAVARNEGNNLADTEFSKDIRLLPINILRRKYGDEVADNQHLYMDARDDQFRINHAERGVDQIVGDATLGVVSGAASAAGGVAAVTLAAAGAVDQYFDSENTGFTEMGVAVAEKTSAFTEALHNQQSDELNDRRGLSGIEAQLDAADNLQEYEERTAGREATFMDDLEWFGRGTLNNMGRVLSDTAVATDVITEGLGSLGPSAKIASVASKLVTTTRTYNAAKIAHAIAPTQGTAILSRGADAVNRSAIAAGVGLSEGAGVYADTVNNILARTHGQLMDGSPEYVDMIENGIDPDDAKTVVASNAGMEAFGRQFPTAMALGLLTARFEAAPMASFRGSGFVGGLRTVGAQTLEEGGQGATGGVNRNMAIRDNVDPSQTLMEGIPEEFAVGAIAGTGMAGVLATPAAIGNTPRVAAQAIRDVTNTDTVKKVASVTASGVATGLDVISKGAEVAKKSKAGIATATAAMKAKNKAVEVAQPAIEAVEDFNDRPDAKIQSENLETAATIDELSKVELKTPITDTKNAAEDVKALGQKLAVQAITKTKTKEAVPTTFKENISEGGTVLENVTGLMKTFASKGFRIKRMSDADAMYAAGQIAALQGSTVDLPVKIRNQVKKVLASPDFKAVKERVSSIDLNQTQNDDTSITNETVSETIAVAKTNPVNVNPTVIGKVIKKLLKQDGRTDVDEQTTHVMKGAQKISLAINTYIGDVIDIHKDENVELLEKPDYKNGNKKVKPVDLPEAVSRNILVGQLKDSRGKPLPSIKDRLADIFAGAQSPDGKYISNGIPVRTAVAVNKFGMFAQHMINKVEALNMSYDNRNAKGTGTLEQFNSLVDGTKMVFGASKGMTYQAGSPGGVAFARRVHSDAALIVEVYNAAVETFPKDFPDGKISVPELRGFETEVEGTPTVVEEASAAPAPEADETRTQEDFDKMSPEERVESANSWSDDIQLTPMSDTDKAIVLDAIGPRLAEFGMPDEILFDIHTLEGNEENLGRAFWAERIIGLAPSVVDRINEGYWKDGVHVAYHEAMHSIDAFTGPSVGVLSSVTNPDFDVQDGEIYIEIKNLIETDEKMKAHFEYAMGFRTAVDLASELFAEIGALYMLDPVKTKLKLPKGVAYVESIIEKAGGTIPDATANEETDTTESGAEPQDGDNSEGVSGDEVSEGVNDKSFDHVDPKFTESFIPRDVELDYGNGADILNMVSEQADTEGFVDFVKTHMDDLMAMANSRLKKFKVDNKSDNTIFDLITNPEEDNPSQYRKYKNTIMVDQITGEYDPDLLSIAAVAVLDWLSAVRSSDPSRLKDTMENMGVQFSDLSEEDIQDIMFGVPPRESAEGLAKTVVRMWGMQINKNAPMVDARGAAESMVKELLESFIQLDTKLLEVKMVPFRDKKTKRLNDQATFNVRPMIQKQIDMGINGQGAVTKMLAPEFDTMPSIGQKISSVDQTQSRGDIVLTKLEKTALKKMQDTPHMIADAFSSMVSIIGYDAIADYLGRKSSADLNDLHPLRASIEGKNLSIERDFQEALMVVDGIRNTEGDGFPSVYYKIGISKVGRHQFKGINPQNNKILRALVTPTHATLDMESQKHKNAFWLTVSQASGINKVENNNHQKILSEIQSKFTDKFGDAVDIVFEYLQTGEMDGAALTEAMGGSGDMQQLAAVFAVAELEKATVDSSLGEFKTTLSFELDGKTDGPGNMMVNFGQGILSPMDYENFKRVGFFIGTKLMTLNKYFGSGENKDLYEITSLMGQTNLYNQISNAAPGEKDRLWAMTRFATHFGDLEIDPDTGKHVMTRTTAKNPMTKTVYGSSERGVGQGLANDMVMKMYEMLIGVPSGKDPAVHFGYADFEADFELLFKTPYPKNVNWKKSFLNKGATETFTSLTTSTLGKILSETAKSVIGDNITEVNDTLVLLTSFQTEFLTAKFEELLTTMVNKRVEEGIIPLTPAGKPNMLMISQADYDGVVDQIKEYSPTYANGMQTLDIGSLEPTDSGIRLSATMDDKLYIASSMATPELAGVKVIPYITQGRGDAMMMNRVYGAENAPDGTLPVFDGIDMAIDKIEEYADTINGAVMQNWDADVLGDVVNDFTGFFEKTKEDGDLLLAAWKRALAEAKKKNTTSLATTPEQMITDLHEMHRLNKARKTVFRRIGISVDHMGGSNTAWTRGADGKVYSLGEINNMISKELGRGELEGDPVETTSDEDGIIIEGTATDVTPDDAAPEALQIEDQRKPEEGKFSKITITDVASVIHSLLQETRKKHVQATVRVLKESLPSDTRIVIGSPEEVTAWYTENVGDMENALIDNKGIYDPENNVMLITENNHETMTHELIHMATFQTVLDVYESGVKSETVSRLEDLAKEFMDMNFSKENKRVRDAANSAKTQILGYQANTDAFSKAAALNEFMSWTLSNEALMKELKKRQTGTIANLTKVVKSLMRRLIGKIPQDIFTNILFNTQLLINGDLGDRGQNGNNGGDGNDSGEVTPTAHNLTGFWIDLAKQRLEDTQKDVSKREARTQQIGEYRDNAKKALDALSFGGFTLDAYQQETFKAIHTVLAMEMRLDTQSSIALNSLFEFVTDNLTPEMFGPDNAQDRFSAIMELFGDTKNDEGVSDAIAVLLALSQTSKGFRRALDQLPTPPSESDISFDSMNDLLGSVTGSLMNKAVVAIDTADGSVRETLDKLSHSILVEESEKEFRVLAGLMKNITKADDYLSGGFKLLAQIAEDANIEVQASDHSKLTKIVAGSLTAAVAFMDQDKADIQAEGLTHLGVAMNFPVAMREFITEVVGTTEINANLMAQLDRTTFAVSSIRQNFREELPIILQDEFNNHPDESQWKAAHHVLGKTDFAVLFDGDNTDTSFRMISDEAFLDKKIARSESLIRSNFKPAVAGTILSKGQQLANFMNGKGVGFQLWTNAFAINMMAGNYQPNLTSEIDKLVSMYALKASDPQQRIQITKMYKDDPQGVKSLVTYMQALNREEDLKVISINARMGGYKGYVPDAGVQGSKTIIANDDNREGLEKQGYIRIGDATADEDFSVISRGYYTTKTKQTGTYSQGIMQTVQDTYRGVDATTGLSVNGTTSGVIAGEAVESITDELNTAQGISNDKEGLIPRFDDEGVVYYERAINPDILAKHQAPKSNLALMLGSWAGRQVEEKLAQEYNRELLVELKRIYDARGPEDDVLYVNLPQEKLDLDNWERGSKTYKKNHRKPDRIYVDSWKVISPQTKKMIDEIFGEDQFFVRKDQMNLALGYRDPSIVDMWTGDTRVPKAVQEGVQAVTSLVMGKHAMKGMAALEGATQGVVSTAKDIIVVRSLVVPYMNTQANVFQLSTRGIGFKQMLNEYPNKLSEIEQYNKNAKKLIRLDTQIELAGTDKNRVAVLNQQKQVILDQNKRFSIAPLIDAGAYKNISEGITDLDVDLTTGRLGEWVENQTNKLPNGVQTVAKYGLLSKDTALYKGANKAVQYGDFIAKTIYYDSLIAKGLTHDAAMKLVNEEFVNFSVLPGRTRTAMESYGATWFLTFKIRIMKIAMNQLRENPARALIVGSTVGDLGSPVADNLVSVIADDRLGYSLGWEMMFGSAGLNPWLNVIDWVDD